jgi:hypothetical protein
VAGEFILAAIGAMARRTQQLLLDHLGRGVDRLRPDMLLDAILHCRSEHQQALDLTPLIIELTPGNGKLPSRPPREGARRRGDRNDRLP